MNPEKYDNIQTQKLNTIDHHYYLWYIYHKSVVSAINTTMTPINTIQTITAAKYLNISNVITEKTFDS